MTPLYLREVLPIEMKFWGYIEFTVNSSPLARATSYFQILRVGSQVGFWVFWVFSGQVTEPLDFSSSQVILTKIFSGQILTITYPKVFVDLRKNLMAQLPDLRKLKKPKTQPTTHPYEFSICIKMLKDLLSRCNHA